MLHTYTDIPITNDRSHSFRFKMLACMSQVQYKTQRYFAQMTEAFHAVKIPLKPF